MTIVNCKTKEEWIAVRLKNNLQELDPKLWDIYKTNSCLNIKKKTYADIEYYNKEGYLIISFEKYMKYDLVPLIFN